MSTTASAIRSVMITAIKALTPTTYASDKFVPFRHQTDFRTWAEGHPGECLRRFSIQPSGSPSRANIATTLTEEVSEEFEVVVAYPNTNRLGEDGLSDLYDTIAADLVQIHKTIGPPGYASFTAQATVLDEGNATSREVGAAVTFGVLRYRVDYYRSVA